MTRLLHPIVTAGLLAAVLVVANAGHVAAQDADATAAPADPAVADQPYAGLEERTIRALSPERIDDLLAGRGAGYALAAELNHYPGPTHVLELADALELTPAQRTATEDILAPMQAAAQAMGRTLVDTEARLDEAFRSGTIGREELTDLTAESARLEGELRAVHLAAHLAVREVLTAEQVRRYDELRGYTPTDEAPASADHQHPGSGH
jgi:Spy/CpxP family protein refolding chaperone